MRLKAPPWTPGKACAAQHGWAVTQGASNPNWLHAPGSWAGRQDLCQLMLRHQLDSEAEDADSNWITNNIHSRLQVFLQTLTTHGSLDSPTMSHLTFKQLQVAWLKGMNLNSTDSKNAIRTYSREDQALCCQFSVNSVSCSLQPQVSSYFCLTWKTNYKNRHVYSLHSLVLFFSKVAQWLGMTPQWGKI